MDESDIMRMIVSDQSWEQIIYEIIAFEGLDPWDLDIAKLSESFAAHISKLEAMDFSLPAKYVIIAAVMLRMKVDNLQFLDFGREEEDMGEPHTAGECFERIDVSPLPMPPKRMMKRKIVVEELIAALRRALSTQERRDRRKHAVPRIEINNFDIEERIESLYSKINAIMSGMGNGSEVRFSDIVPKWERAHIVETFLPLMHLDNSSRLECRQEEFFKDIFIKVGEANLKVAKKAKGDA